MTNKTFLEKKLNKIYSEIMDWFYETVKINFGIEMVQDSSDLREIIRENLTEFAEEMKKIIETHLWGEGEWCDTGEDMEWACRSKCVELALKRISESLIINH